MAIAETGVFVSYTYLETPDNVIKTLVRQQCPDGYTMRIRCQTEWGAIAACVNEGIDSHLEAITDRSSFNAETGECCVHPDELHVLCRRLIDHEEAWDLRGAILDTLGIEEI